MYSNLRHVIGACALRSAITSMERRKLDLDKLNEPIIRDPNSGVDRVLMIFERDEYGSISPELALANVSAFMAGLIGGIRSGIQQAYLANISFKQNNEITLFQSQLTAGKQMNDAMTIGFARGMAKGALRYGLFCFSLVGLSTIIARYRNKSGILEYSLSGMITGSLFKISLGPKGMISGAFFGFVIASFFGAMTNGLLKLSGVPMQDIYNACHEYFRKKDFYFHGAYKTQAEHEDIIITFCYPDGMDSKSHTLDHLEDLKDESELKFNTNNSVKIRAEAKINEDVK